MYTTYIFLMFPHYDLFNLFQQNLLCYHNTCMVLRLFWKVRQRGLQQRRAIKLRTKINLNQKRFGQIVVYYMNEDKTDIFHSQNIRTGSAHAGLLQTKLLKLVKWFFFMAQYYYYKGVICERNYFDRSKIISQQEYQWNIYF